jgi:MtrB/PioB family decaheme-associated outer membrane protein
MKRCVGFVKFVIGAVVSGAAMASTGALAQTATTAVSAQSAMAAADPVPYLGWWFHGTVEVGGRAFLNSPQKSDQTATGPTLCGATGSRPCGGVMGQSLGGYYEYSDVKPGAFSNIDLAGGSKDGLYQYNLGGANIGYNDQSYYLDLSKAGEQYFNFVWDETPHIYSTSALTPFVVNGNALTLVPGAVGKATSSALAPFAQPMTIGIQRDTASAHYRWTPNDAWDINADYSYLNRTGTQVGGVDGNTAAFGGVNQIQLPKPVNDTTQNYSVNGEYVGTSPWGKRYLFKAGYTGSQYTDNYAAFTVPNILTGALGGQVSLPPSNQANGATATLAADDLPWHSRYAGTVNYTMMTQNAAFIPAGVNIAFNAPPRSSLDGDINTLLSNNVVTTKITSDLTSKLSYRYYNFKNNTPELFLANPPCNIGAVVGCAPNGVNTISMGYVKQNAAEELNWRPTPEWNFGAAYGYERYDWTRADVDATNENSGKIFADWKPSSWLTVRSSGYYAVRRYENYNNLLYVGTFQWPNNSGNMQYAQSYRQLMYDNRNAWKANLAIDFVALRNLTITPTVKYQDTNYGVDPNNQQGLQDSNGWAAGVDAVYVVNPSTSLMVGYMFEYNTQLLYGCSGPAQEGLANSACTPASVTTDNSTIHTFTTAVRYAAIPDKLDTEVRYTAAHGSDNMELSVPPTGNPTTGGQFPLDTTWFQRLDAIATYKFDKETVAQLGWKGDVKAKLHYAWESNSVANWANDGLTPFTIASGNSVLWMTWNNPNYNVHMIMASLAFGW